MSTADKPKVIIVGAGLGGLMLGALLEKSDIQYQILERATTVKPLGTAHCRSITAVIAAIHT